jgi:hypothetical protein
MSKRRLRLQMQQFSEGCKVMNTAGTVKLAALLALAFGKRQGRTRAEAHGLVRVEDRNRAG